MIKNATKAVGDDSFRESFADLFEASVSKIVKEGTVVKGEIIKIESEYAVIDFGHKTEGLVPLKEFSLDSKPSEITVGDIVDVYIERTDSKLGRAILSFEKAQRESAWKNIESALTEGKKVEGFICGKVKGGYTVDLSGVIAFLPGSQVDIRPIKDISPLFGMVQPFKILKIDRKQSNIVLSRRAILEESRLEAREEMLAKIEEGQILDGFVKNITDYGAFVDLGSLDGLLHLTDIAWNRINHPSEVLSLGQQIKVKIIKYNPETKRVSLGMKQLEENPWKDLEDKFPRGAKVKGKVSSIADYGVFVEIEEGIEGLVHVSEITWSKSNPNPHELLSVGQQVECLVLDIDTNKHRISLGIKQCEENPWAKFAETHEVGSVVEGEVRNVVEFGVFIALPGNIDGLLHLADISWEDESTDRLNDFKPGDKISAKVLSVDIDKERITLGIKQMGDDPFQSATSGINKGDKVKCVVKEIHNDSIDVELNGVTLNIKKIDLAASKADQDPSKFKEGETIEAKVTNYDRNTRKVVLSIKALEVEEQKKAIAEYTSSDNAATTLGDILGQALKKGEK
ncbi:30S ribosomal protein S1 [Rickettsiales endosymbiont of Stachyamoeba lipophora]|uniref:30S ribosomal protein S1 n=1 Tax=Rickettsiales endosymbiont of Stachyamoeba lipophora TaxID=2486578 RepID=UPI000F646A41|nr:30S ribosomal protein S1 [Rickettsiales endosymbiont of Stachyamoeba lipophora]AZL15830.1 30S ribosomal protein S1 [Rickettsiales endosymbiont of Stachyamoeba lipophora]